MIIDTASTCWMLVTSVLILVMTLPGVLMFYAGMVHRKNVVSVLAIGFTVVSLMSLMWIFFGWSLGYTTNANAHLQPFIGSARHMFLWGVDDTSVINYRVPVYVAVMFHMGFALVAPAFLISGVAERMRVSAIFIFFVAWELLVYYPECHWLWGRGWLASLGVVDFAGGMVVHISVGVSALVMAMMLGRRSYLKSNEQFHPHNLSLVMIGLAFMWVGWFGFNGGSAHAINAVAGLAMLNTQVSAAAGAITWVIVELKTLGRPSVVGIACGVLAGLVGVSTDAGYIGILGGALTGFASGLISFYASRVKHFLRFDDALDAFSVNGVAGMLGALLAPLFAVKAMGGLGLDGGLTVSKAFLLQLLGVVSIVAWSMLMTWLILWVLKKTIGIHLSSDSELQGIDRTAYGEEGYRL